MSRNAERATKYSLIAALVIVCAGEPALAIGDLLGVEVQYWSQSMSGEVQVNGTLPGSRVDPHDDLGLDRTDNLAAARVWLHWLKRNYLFVTSYDSSRSGEKVLTRSLIFNDQLFPAGDNVRSRLDVQLASLLYGYNFLDLKVVKVGFRLGAHRLDFDGDLRSTTFGTSAKSGESVTFPVVGLGISVRPMPLLRFTGEISGVTAHAHGDDVLFEDARAQAEFYVNPFVGFHAGYRQVRIDVDLQDFGSAEVTQKGPYAGVTVKF